jgi:3-oxoacyl-[acyl-carrier protein] reductase
MLINSAGTAIGARKFFGATADTWPKQIQTSTFYVVHLDRLKIPQTRAHGWGRMLHFSSRAACRGIPNHPEYSSAKLAQHSLTASFVAELGDCGVTVNTLVAGVAMTPNTKRLIELSGAKAGFPETGADLAKRVIRDVWQAQIPLARVGEVEDLTAAASFLSSQAASHVTGTALRADGGATGYVA